MKFDKNHLVDIESLTKDEARIFLAFLWLERERHTQTARRCNTWAELWVSEAQRQMEGVEHIDGGIEEVEKKFKLELEEK